MHSHLSSLFPDMHSRLSDNSNNSGNNNNNNNNNNDNSNNYIAPFALLKKVANNSSIAHQY